MFSLLSPLGRYFKIKSVCIYDGVFILHSKITVSILLACTIIISAKQYFGEPIGCITDTKNQEFINNFCWTFGTYILQYSQNDNNSNLNIIQSEHHKHLPFLNYHQTSITNELIEIGIGPETKTSKRIYLRYYQWVVLILLLQALSFFLPGYLWKYWEGGRLQDLCNELGSALVPDEWNKKRKEMLVNYFSSNYKEIHMFYALKYAICEILNFIICIINIFLMNIIFSGFWSNYASAISVLTSYEWNEWNRITSKVFPKMAKCEFKNFGSSGSTQKLDVLCLLPLNIINEKLFAFLWFWFIIIFLISCLNIIYRILLLFNSKFRLQLLNKQLNDRIKLKQIYKIVGKLNFGDWFLLYKVSNNVNPIIFEDLIHELLITYTKKKDISTDDNNRCSIGIIV